MQKLTQEENDIRFKKAIKLIATGVKSAEAIKQVGMNHTAFYNRKRSGKEPTKVVKRASPRKLLNVQDLPSMPAQGVPGIFMVFGSPDLLASFAKGMQ